MKFLVVLCSLLACALAKPEPVFGGYYGAVPYSYGYTPYSVWGSPLAYAHHVVPQVAPVGVKTQYHAQDFLGQATYGHVEPGQVHTAVQDAAGNKVGSFSFVKSDGSVARTDYVADALGYRVASNDLPVAPVVDQVAPVPVVDTPEVVAARAAHFAKVEEAKTRTRRAIFPASTSPLVVPQVVPVAPVAPRVVPVAPITPVHHVAPFTHVASVAPFAYSYPLAVPHHVPVVAPAVVDTVVPEVTEAEKPVVTRNKRAIAPIPVAGHYPYTTAYGYSYTHPIAYTRTYNSYPYNHHFYPYYHHY